MRIIMMLLLAIVTCQSATAQMGKLDTRYIDEDSFFVVQFDIQKIISHEKMGSKSIETITKFLRDNAKIELSTLESITLQFGNGAVPEEFDEDSFSVIMKFSKLPDREAYLEAMSLEADKTEFEGKTYYQSKNSYSPSIFFSEENHIVLAYESTLTGLMKEKKGDAPLSALMNSAPPGSEMVGAFRNTDAFKSVLAGIQNDMAFSPFNLEKVYGKAESGFMHMQVTSGTPIHLQLNCSDEESAEKLARKTTLLVNLGKAAIPIGREAIKRQAETLPADFGEEFKEVMAQQMKMANEALTFAETLVNATQTSHMGKTAYLKVKKMGGIKDMVATLAELISSQFLAVDQMQREFEEDLGVEPDFE